MVHNLLVRLPASVNNDEKCVYYNVLKQLTNAFQCRNRVILKI